MFARAALAAVLLLVAVLGAPAGAAAATNDTITSFTAVGTPFAPDFAPLPTVVTIDLTLARNARVTVDVLNAKKRVVRVIQPKTPLAAGHYSWSWDGVNATGGMARDGAYKIRVRAKNVLGTAAAKRPVRKGLPAIFPANPGAITIVVDPGHGGRFSGAVWKKVAEKYYNLLIALNLRDLLEHAGVKVVMTRTTDVAVDQPESDVNGDGIANSWDDLEKRNDIANQARADINIHVHNNSADCHCTRGTSVYTNMSRTWTPQARVLANDLQVEQLAQLAQFSDGTYYPVDRGVRKGKYYYMVPYAVTCPTAAWHTGCSPEYQPRPSLPLSVLMESLFVDNSLEHALLERNDARVALAAAMYMGIADWLNSRDYGIAYDTVGAEPTTAYAGDNVSFGIRVTNRGNKPSNGWTLRLGAVPWVPLYDGSPAPGNLVGSVAIPNGLQPGQSVDLVVNGVAPPTAGSWWLKTDVRLADNTSLADEGIVALQLALTTTIAP